MMRNRNPKLNPLMMIQNSLHNPLFQIRILMLHLIVYLMAYLRKCLVKMEAVLGSIMTQMAMKYLIKSPLDKTLRLGHQLVKIRCQYPQVIMMNYI
jgi:hypothetical protein